MIILNNDMDNQVNFLQSGKCSYLNTTNNIKFHVKFIKNLKLSQQKYVDHDLKGNVSLELY